jgi:hypothetical protein
MPLEKSFCCLTVRKEELPSKVILGENPNPDEKPVAVSSAESSKTAKMVNAYNALILAEKMSILPVYLY